LGDPPPVNLGVSLLEFLTSDKLRNELGTNYTNTGWSLIDAFGSGITFAYAKVKFPEWEKPNYDVLGNSNPTLSISQALWYLFFDTPIQLRDLADTAAPQVGVLMGGLQRIAIHSDDTTSQTTEKLVAYKRSGGQIGLWRSTFERNPAND